MNWNESVCPKCGETFNWATSWHTCKGADMTFVGTAQEVAEKVVETLGVVMVEPLGLDVFVLVAIEEGAE